MKRNSPMNRNLFKGAPMYCVWSESDKAFVKNNPQMTDREFAHYFSKVHKREISVEAMKKFRQRMGEKKIRGRKEQKRKDNFEPDKG